MAKPALGRGLGELLNGNGASETSTATETRTTAPRMSAGLSTLVHNAADTPPPAASAPAPRVVRASLLAADAVLTCGAFLFLLKQSSPDAISTVAALLALLFGGWLGWLGLTWGRSGNGR